MMNAGSEEKERTKYTIKRERSMERPQNILFELEKKKNSYASFQKNKCRRTPQQKKEKKATTHMQRKM